MAQIEKSKGKDGNRARITKLEVAFKRLSALVDELNARTNTGWETLFDDQYTDVSPLVIAQDATEIIDINGSTRINAHLPEGVTQLFDVSTSKLLPVKIGDTQLVSFTFKASTNNNSGSFQVGVDIGGAFGILFENVSTFPKGSNVTTPFHLTITGYQLDTFFANGGIPKIKSVNGITSIWDISMKTEIVSKGKTV